MSTSKNSVEEIKDNDINDMIGSMEEFNKYITSILKIYKDNLNKRELLSHNKPDSNITDLKYNKFILTNENKQLLKTLIIKILKNYINLITTEKNRHDRNIDITSALQLALISLQYNINIFTTIITQPEKDDSSDKDDSSNKNDSFEIVSIDKIDMDADASIVEHIQSLYQSYILQKKAGIDISSIEDTLNITPDKNQQVILNSILYALYKALYAQNERKHTGTQDGKCPNNNSCRVMNKYIKYKLKYVKLKQLLGK